ncbi:MupA/Atu3671 family FMN-dependent luciferase-like monooxygenase [Acanthopleuribacter pedis]|uniref:LLM class flavin-dependent oxidoreductase n=1 Tax=Acanthopleuribacter pedis TaxID=442870 RepID=A0A8J7QFZ4_9BACT|nr:MupA/Atu3671 family FMN-dependent luciferase-like monooxygenase [Acanthopleuribacter pedis]MBO1317800.1 LLM class flavin-dependent oxidoreductase [Acanthopleuribacter pedis]
MNQPVDRNQVNQRIADLLAFDRRPAPGPAQTAPKKRAPDMSLIFFSDSNQGLGHTYQLVFELTEFADRAGFAAVWLPERHFHPFGGIYPNPAVLAAALARTTEQIRFRSGSVVLPLHHPVEVVEAWSMVDHLSGGRVDLGFASGWNPNDFIISPETYGDLRKVWFERIGQVEKLWRGETMRFANGKGEATEVRVYPKPLQEQLNVWLAISKSEESFRFAGAKGYNVLTMLQGIDLDKLGEKIAIYREARAGAGFDPDGGCVTLMLHTLVHRDLDTVRAAVREPFFNYIKSALTGHMQTLDKADRPGESEVRKMVEYSYERYFKTGALFGGVDDVMPTIEKAVSVGVGEIACLMDFGPEHRVVMESLPYLQSLKEQVTSLSFDS